MKLNLALLASAAITLCAIPFGFADDSIPEPPADWLVDPSSFKAQVHFDETKHDLVLENGLTRRTLRLTPNAATVDYSNLVTNEQIKRTLDPKFLAVTMNNVEYAIGGLKGSRW